MVQKVSALNWYRIWTLTSYENEFKKRKCKGRRALSLLCWAPFFLFFFSLSDLGLGWAISRLWIIFPQSTTVIQQFFAEAELNLFFLSLTESLYKWTIQLNLNSGNLYSNLLDLILLFIRSFAFSSVFKSRTWEFYLMLGTVRAHIYCRQKMADILIHDLHNLAAEALKTMINSR